MIAGVVLWLLALAAFAGENVRLLDANGKPLGPSQLDKVNIKKTCGDCHDVTESAKTVHFNRKQSSADPESSNCLSCHLSKKDAFNTDGTVKKMTPNPEDASCISCHTDLEKCSHAGAHAKLSCYDCHRDAGHKTAGAASCQGCHSGKSIGPRPKHAGLPALHLARLSCEACHIAQVPDSGAAPGHAVKNAVIVTIGDSGAEIHHCVAKAADARGAKGCRECHSTKSAFFFGTTTTDKVDNNGNPVKIPTYRSLGLTRTSVFISALREKLLKPFAPWLFLLMIAMSLAHYAIFGPKRVHIPENDPQMVRFSVFERLIHLLAILSFLFLAISGILFMLHIETPTSSLRSIHGHVGMLFVLAVIGMLMIWYKNGRFASCDKDWICNLGGYLWIKAECPAEKFNAGQKIFYWLVVIAGGLLASATGILLLAHEGAAPSWVYTLHDVAGVALIASILGHVYLSVFANPGTIMGVITGKVPESWAKHHHPNWYIDCQ